jgi:hypothetical protein
MNRAQNQRAYTLDEFRKYIADNPSKFAADRQNWAVSDSVKPEALDAKSISADILPFIDDSTYSRQDSDAEPIHGEESVIEPILNQSIFDSLVTSVPNVKEPGNFRAKPLRDVLDEIRNDTYKSKISKLRSLPAVEYNAAKKNLPAISFTGTFADSVTNNNFLKSSGLFPGDIDGLDKETIEQDKAKIAAIPFVVAVWVSPSGNGLKFLIKIDPESIKNDADFKRVFPHVEAMFAKEGYTLDKSCKDVRRLCFVSHDPKIYINWDAKQFELPDNVTQSGKSLASKPNVVLPTIVENESDCLERCLNILSAATPGNRHESRLRAGRLAGGFIAGGQIDEAKITDLLMQVSDRISDDGVTSEGERRTLFDSINHGKETPILPTENWRIKLDAHVEEWNKIHASVVIGGKHKVMRWTTATHDGRAAYEFLNRKDLKLAVRQHQHESW